MHAVKVRKQLEHLRFINSCFLNEILAVSQGEKLDDLNTSKTTSRAQSDISTNFGKDSPGGRGAFIERGRWTGVGGLSL